MMKKKLGLITDEPEDAVLIKELLDVMEKNKLDYTNTFRDLMNENIKNENLKDFSRFYKSIWRPIVWRRPICVSRICNS